MKHWYKFLPKDFAIVMPVAVVIHFQMPDSQLNPEPRVEQNQQGILKRDASSKVPKTGCGKLLVLSGYTSKNGLPELGAHASAFTNSMSAVAFVLCRVVQSLKI